MLKNCNRNRVYLNIIIAIAIFYYMPLVLSAPPVTQVTSLNRGIDIIHPETPYVQLGKNLELNFWTYNSTDGRTITNASTNCTVYIINSSGYNFWRFSNQAGASGLITYGKGSPLCINCWTMIMPSQNLSTGLYSYQIKCQGLGLGGYVTGYFEVTPNGLEKPEQNTLIFFVILSLIILCLTTYITIYSIGHLTSMDFDILDLAINWSMFFFIAGFYYFEIIHFQDLFIGKFMEIFLYPAGIFLILIPIIAFIISTFIGTLNKKMYRQRVPKRLIGGHRNEKEI